jgi:hypothetical protein
MAKYLYGASVQGIQGFIFQTNKLAEIVGASELVEQICTSIFHNVSNFKGDDQNIILAAAGNIKCIFDDENKCNQVVKMFPKTVMQMAPGITISQAVVKIEGDKPTAVNFNILETKLKAQRNAVSMPIETGFMCLERARRTGGVVYGNDKNISSYKNDEATLLKLEAKETKKLFSDISGVPKNDIHLNDLALDISEISKAGKSSWIAVIHADGNGLGKIIQNHGDTLTEQGKFKQFSNAIESATKKACQTAFNQVILPEKNDKNRYPIRPIILGGDDLTIIIRADLAVEFTKIFLKQFEIESINEFKTLAIPEIIGLTACAGIAFVNDSYPLHYALDLADELCKDAKKMVKADGFPKDGEMIKSSLAFFKVQDSFVERLDEMKNRTMRAQNGINYDYGPYLLHKIEDTKYANIVDLDDKLKKIKVEADKNDKSKGVSKLRQLVSVSFKDTSTMQLMKDRMKTINDKFYESLGLDHELNESSKSILYDLIQLHGFNY